MKNITTFNTTELKLAAWLLYQDGANLDGVATVAKASQSDRAGRSKCLSTFHISMEICAMDAGEAVALYHNEQAIVVVQQYEQVRNQLLAAMRESHDQARAAEETT